MAPTKTQFQPVSASRRNVLPADGDMPRTRTASIRNVLPGDAAAMPQPAPAPPRNPLGSSAALVKGYCGGAGKATLLNKARRGRLGKSRRMLISQV